MSGGREALAGDERSGRAVVLVLAGGSGTRFGADQSKVYVRLGHRPILAYALHALERSDVIDDVVVVVRDGDRAAYEVVAAAAPTTKVRAVATGGRTRQGSEQAGLDAAAAATPTADLVLLHDAARPFLTLDLLADLVGIVRRTGGGAVPAVGLLGDLVDADGLPVATGDLVSVQTPQAFPAAVLRDVYPRAAADGFEGSDTAQTVQAYADVAVTWVPGTQRNLKITHPEDLAIAEALLPAWDEGTWRA